MATEGDGFVRPRFVTSDGNKTSTGSYRRSLDGFNLIGVLAWTGDAKSLARASEQQHSVHVPENPHTTYALANRLFVSKALTLVPGYAQLTASCFFSPAERTAFGTDPEGSRQRINQWVEKRTHERIVGLIPSGEITSKTELVLTNALYLKTRWRAIFGLDNTIEDTFYVDGRNRGVEVSFMRQTGSFPYADMGIAQLIEMPRLGDRWSVVVVLPHDRSDLPKVEKALSSGSMRQWIGGLVPKRLSVPLPRFGWRCPSCYD
ncbi:MAG: serpin family protein [Myxococcota bacterium]